MGTQRERKLARLDRIKRGPTLKSTALKVDVFSTLPRKRRATESMEKTKERGRGGDRKIDSKRNKNDGSDNSKTKLGKHWHVIPRNL